MSTTQKQKAQEYFLRNPLQEKVYGTSDGFLFTQKQNAIKHGTTLTNKEVTTYKNEKPEIDEDSEVTDLLQLSISKLTAELKKVDDPGLIEALLIQEKGADAGGRKGAIEALDDRLKELKEG